MTDEPKFCKDCKHFREGGAVALFGSGFAWPESCAQPPERDLIHGYKITADPRRMRGEHGACKPEALLWEEKPAPEVVLTIVTEPPTAVKPERQFTQADADAENARMKRATYQQAWWEFWK
jgi:hypothetical protein